MKLQLTRIPIRDWNLPLLNFCFPVKALQLTRIPIRDWNQAEKGLTGETLVLQLTRIPIRDWNSKDASSEEVTKAQGYN